MSHSLKITGMRSLVILLLSPLGLVAAEIPSGTHVLLRMVNSLSTRTAREGDQVYLQTASPIAVGGQMLVPVGAYVQGTVAHAQRSGRVSGRAELAIHLDTLMLASGKSVTFTPRLAAADPEETGQKVEGGESTIKQAPGREHDAGQIAIYAGRGAGLGAIVGAVSGGALKGAGIGAGAGAAVGLATVLLTRGHELDLRAGSTLDVVFDRPVEIE